MKVLYNQKSEKFTISGLTFDHLVQLHSDSSCTQLKDAIYKALSESLDPDEIQDEYGYSVREYLGYLLK